MKSTYKKILAFFLAFFLSLFALNISVNATTSGDDQFIGGDNEESNNLEGLEGVNITGFEDDEQININTKDDVVETENEESIIEDNQDIQDVEDNMVDVVEDNIVEDNMVDVENIEDIDSKENVVEIEDEATESDLEDDIVEESIKDENSVIEIRFNDVDDSFAHEYIVDLANIGAVSGYNDGSFRPNLPTTRAELLKIVLVSNGYNYDNIDVSDLSFPDVDKNTWVARAVVKGLELGFINGYKDGTFRPNETISRWEALKIVMAARGVAVDDDIINVFSDVDGYAVKYVNTAKNLGIINGQTLDNGLIIFRQDDSITRAEVAKIVINAATLKLNTDSVVDTEDLEDNIVDIEDVDSKENVVEIEDEATEDENIEENVDSEIVETIDEDENKDIDEENIEDVEETDISDIEEVTGEDKTIEE